MANITMTFDEYINNPMGQKNAVYSNRNLYRNLYTEKFNKLMVRENSNVNYRVWKSKDAYFVLLKVPSETVEDLYYDVCIKFDTKKVTPKGTIKDCPVKFFSNDPFFCFTFAYAFNKKGIFVNELTSKMEKTFLKERAVERNPSNEVGYDKIIYFAYLMMQLKGLFNLALIDSVSRPYSEHELLNSVTSSRDKINERQEKGADNNKAISREKRKVKSTNQAQPIHQPIGNNIGMVKTTGVSRTTKSSGNIRTSSRVKKIGKR